MTSVPMSDRQLLDTLYSAQKAALWEQAKGALRAVVAAVGSTHTGGRNEAYETLEKLVEDLITEVVGEGLVE